MGKRKFESGSIIKGKDLQECALCIILTENMAMGGLQYKLGMNVDVNFLGMEKNCNAGLHFTLVQDACSFLDYGAVLAIVRVPDEEDVYVDFDMFRTHSLEIKDMMPLSTVAAWNFLVENGADITAGDDHAIIEAAAEGHLEVVKYLHKNGAGISTCDNYAVRWAAAEGHLEVVKYLHENGADITACDNEAIINASESGHLEVVKYLHENGADITANCNAAVRWAKAKEHFEVVKYLCENGADITAEEGADSYLDW